MKTKVWTALLAIYIVWGSTYLAIRFAVETMPPYFMAGTRFLVSGLILYIWRRLAGDPAPTPRQWRSAIIVGLLLLLGGNGLVSWAEQHVASGVAALIVASIPLWVALIDGLRPHGIKPDWKIVLGLAGRLWRHRAAGGFVRAQRHFAGHEPVRCGRFAGGRVPMVHRLDHQPGCRHASIVAPWNGHRDAGRRGGSLPGGDVRRRMGHPEPVCHQHALAARAGLPDRVRFAGGIHILQRGFCAMRRCRWYRRMPM